VPTNTMSRYFQGQLRCEDECLFGRTEYEVHRNIELLHPTISKDIYGYVTDGVVSLKEMEGSCGPTVERVIRKSWCSRSTVLNSPFQFVWCSIYFDADIGYYRPAFLTKETIMGLCK
jgi:hypothetical protein